MIDWLLPLLACPSCRGRLEPESAFIVCLRCAHRFPQPDPRVIDLCLPGEPADRRWTERQREMTRSYAELLEDPEEATLAYRSDYGPLAPLLGGYGGRVLDVGGGNGIARHWLAPGAAYVALDPSLAWLEQPWARLGDAFSCLTGPPCFVRGVAERLPFADGCFDGALALWSLNHVSRAADALREMARVLRPGGRLLVTLEDMPPSWRDVLRPGSAAIQGRFRLGLRKLGSLLGGWPLQSDHLRIRERQLARWARTDLRPLRREWLGAYLTYEVQKV